jgi:addiction module HigA family antidote
MKTKKIPPLHPGVVLYDEFLQPLKISQNKIARDLGVSPRRINEIIHGKRSITADTALRFSLYFGNSAQFWMGLQMDYDLDMARDHSLEKLKVEVSHSIADTIKPLAAGGEATVA